MNPEARFRLIPGDEEQEPHVEIEWLNYNPGQTAEDVITKEVLAAEDDLSKIVVAKGQVIYMRYWYDHRFGASISMDAILDDFYAIGIDTYNWSKHFPVYHDASPQTWEEVGELVQQDFSEEIKEIQKEVRREWFDIAMKGGTITLERDTWDFHFNIACVLGFFPWIVFFGDAGDVTDDEVKLHVEISSDFPISWDEIFAHIDGDLDEQFWVLIYQFVLQLDNIPEEERGDTWYRFLQAVHEFTTESSDYLVKLEHMFNYKDLLPIFDTDFISRYVQGLLMNIAEEKSTPAICTVLLEFSDFLLEFDFTDLAKLTEATTLEHALKLQDYETKYQTIINLTNRSSRWGNDHLISFIQSLIGLLPRDDEGNTLLSDAINQVIEQLRQSWDGLLCIVEAKIIAGKIGEAIEIRFEATKRIGDRQTQGGDVFSGLVWSLDYDFPPQERHDIALPYLDNALDFLPDQAIVDQCLMVIQTCLSLRQLEYLRIFFAWLRGHMDHVDEGLLRIMMEQIAELLDVMPSSPMIMIEFLIFRLFALRYQDAPVDPDQPFQYVSQIYNSINPALSSSAASLQYISEAIIEYAMWSADWQIVEETRKRYLLMAADDATATKHLKTIFFKNALARLKLPTEELKPDDIGIKMFTEGLALADMDKDYRTIVKILPQIKKLVVKSRSYSRLAELVLTEIRLKRLKDLAWLDQFEEDVNTLLRRGNPDDVVMLFEQLFDMDLNEEERKRLLSLQLELTENEPDILTADEIYDKRQQLANLSGDDDQQREFMIDNYQRGVAELMSKGDTTNLNNMLFDAIAYSRTNDSLATEEFKGILLDNFDNITQDVQQQSRPNIYLYLLTIWRKIIDHFVEYDFNFVLITTLKLLKLNHHLFRKSGNNQYLRRSQLVLKEMGLVAETHQIKLNDEQMLELETQFDQLMRHTIGDHEDFGGFAAVYLAAEFYMRISRVQQFLPLLDQTINSLKQEVVKDSDAQSAIFLLLLLLAELNITLDADLDEQLQLELIMRIKRVLNFAQSLSVDNQTSLKLRELQKTINSSEPSAFFHEYPFNLGQYINTQPIWN